MSFTPADSAARKRREAILQHLYSAGRAQTPSVDSHRVDAVVFPVRVRSGGQLPLGATVPEAAVYSPRGFPPPGFRAESFLGLPRPPSDVGPPGFIPPGFEENPIAIEDILGVPGPGSFVGTLPGTQSHSEHISLPSGCSTSQAQNPDPERRARHSPLKKSPLKKRVNLRPRDALSQTLHVFPLLY